MVYCSYRASTGSGVISMTAVKEQFMQMLPEMQRDLEKMPDGDVQQLVNLWIRIKPEKSKAEKMAEFEADMDRSQLWAKEVGLTPEDITRAIKTVRQRKKTQA